MKKQDFDKLADSIRQAGRIRRAKARHLKPATLPSTAVAPLRSTPSAHSPGRGGRR